MEFAFVLLLSLVPVIKVMNHALAFLFDSPLKSEIGNSAELSLSTGQNLPRILFKRFWTPFDARINTSLVICM